MSLVSVSPRVTALEWKNNKHDGGCNSGEHRVQKAQRPIAQNYKFPTQESLGDTQTEKVYTYRDTSTVILRHVLGNKLCRFQQPYNQICCHFRLTGYLHDLQN